MVTKQCTKCGDNKPLTEFHKRIDARDGLRASCRACVLRGSKKYRESIPVGVLAAKTKQWRIDNPGRAALLCSKWRRENPERNAASKLAHYAKTKHLILAKKKAEYPARRATILVKRKGYYDANKIRIAVRMKRYVAANRGKRNATEARRHAAKLRATPAWADRDAILAVYVGAARHGFEVDHIVPLISKLVCGLHLPANLQALHTSLNCAKGNRWWPDMP